MYLITNWKNFQNQLELAVPWKNFRPMVFISSCNSTMISFQSPTPSFMCMHSRTLLYVYGIFTFLPFANVQKVGMSQSYPHRMLFYFMIGVKVDLALFGTQTQHAPQQNMGAAEHFSFSSPMLAPTIHLTRESHVRFCALWWNKLNRI
jgi:hypothetical protein